MLKFLAHHFCYAVERESDAARGMPAVVEAMLSPTTACDEHRLCDAFRLARRIVGRDVRSARDRLLLKMTGRGLGPGATLPLRVESLDVNAFDDLFDRSWTRDVLDKR